ncbi:MAG: 4Fe-4S cluster-binding domain-containing protein [Vulcanimicrobiota bacterium]
MFLPEARPSQLCDGFIIPPNNLELPVTDHCNLTCQDCNHSSPAQAPWFADPDQVYHDLSRLAKVYRPRRVKILGGEPLLHKGLLEVVRAARAANLCQRFFLTTNGMLCDRMTPELWQQLEEIEISRYPGCLSEAIVERARHAANQHGVIFTLVEYNEFKATLSARTNQDEPLVERIYQTCKVAHRWGCHMVRQGYLYKCPRSAYLPVLMGYDRHLDALKIEDEPAFQARLLEFLNSPKPLRACANCLGTVGRSFPHRLLPRAEWRKSLEQAVTDLLDPAFKERLWPAAQVGAPGSEN